MICPNCHALIDDDAVVCPQCHAQVDTARPASFLFCEGCGARLSPEDRTCPKCGRPAPAILSSDSSASDLAAGKTASFPKLSNTGIETELPRVNPAANAQRVLDNALDPNATTVLQGRDISASLGYDPVPPKKRSHKGLVIGIVIVLLAVAGVVFAVFDPFNMMPGMMSSIRSSAEEMFPSRQHAQAGDDGEANDGATAPAAEPEVSIEDSTISDDAAFDQIIQAYDAVVAINDGDRFAEVIDSFNSFYLDPDLEHRTDAATSAYDLRDELQGIIDDLDALQLADDSAYVEDREHVRQLAQWMYERVDVICKSWDVSLAVPEDEYPRDYQDEILAPMQEAGSSALDNYYDHVEEWRPQER